MKRQLLHTPEGVRDIYNDECEKKMLLQDQLYHILRLHGYHPYSILGNNSDKASKILYCACLFYTSDDPISPKETYDAVIAEGIHPWVGAGAVTEEQILRGAEYGGELFTSNHPTYVSEVLRKNGYR